MKRGGAVKFLRYRLLSVTILLLICLVQKTNGQRVIASLGTKLKHLKSQRKSQPVAGSEYVVEGEEISNLFHEYLSPLRQSNIFGTFFTFGLITITLFFFSFYNNSKSRGKEGEFLHPFIRFKNNLWVSATHEFSQPPFSCDAYR